MSRRISVATGILVAVLSCTACGGKGSAQGTAAPGAAGSGTSATTSSAPAASAPATGAGGDPSQFCSTARQVGLRNVQIEDSGNPDVSRLLAGLDTLDGLAPPDLKPDFDRFVGLEKAVLDPANAPTGAAGDINDPDNLAAVGHVEKYLLHTCHVSK